MTEVYNYRNIKMKLDDTVLKRLKDISEELAEEKEKNFKLSLLDFLTKSWRISITRRNIGMFYTKHKKNFTEKKFSSED
jgi:hypothetical protein